VARYSQISTPAYPLDPCPCLFHVHEVFFPFSITLVAGSLILCVQFSDSFLALIAPSFSFPCLTLQIFWATFSFGLFFSFGAFLPAVAFFLFGSSFLPPLFLFCVPSVAALFFPLDSLQSSAVLPPFLSCPTHTRSALHPLTPGDPGGPSFSPSVVPFHLSIPCFFSQDTPLFSQ